MTNLTAVFDYHERIKHHRYRYARSLDYMGWATQTNPFRRWEGVSFMFMDEINPALKSSLESVLDG